MEKRDWEHRGAVLLTIVLGGLLLYVSLRFALPILLPFLFAWLISLPLAPLARRLSTRLHLPLRLSVLLLLLAVSGLSVWGISAATERLIRELGALVERLLSGNELSTWVGHVTAWVEQLLSRLGILSEGGEWREEQYEMMTGVLGDLLSSVASGLPSLVTKAVSSLPTVFFVLLIIVISAFKLNCIRKHNIKYTRCHNVLGC